MSPIGVLPGQLDLTTMGSGTKLPLAPPPPPPPPPPGGFFPINAGLFLNGTQSLMRYGLT